MLETNSNPSDPALPYLSELLTPDQFAYGRVNLVIAPCHSGKSTAARKLISDFGFMPEKVLYLIDTTAGKESLLSHEMAQTIPYEWAEWVDPSWHVHDSYKDRFVTMTYHHFGECWRCNPFFLWDVDLIICDEMHNLLKFAKIQESKREKLGIPDGIDVHLTCAHAFDALTKLTTAPSHARPMIIAITATPDQLLRAFEKHQTPYHAFDYRGKVHYDKTRNRVYYSDFKSIADQLVDRAIIYVPTINQMLELADYLDYGLQNIVCLWSIHNEEHPMSDEQLAVRDAILKTECIPEDIDILLINAAYETSINIRNEDFNTVIIHSANPDVQTQVRGRLRHDIDTLYLHDKSHEHISDYFPEEYYDRLLFWEEKNEIIERMHMTDKNGRLLKWPSIQKLLKKDGLIVTEGRVNYRRYVRVLRNSAA